MLDAVAAQAVTDAELEAHIGDCARLMEAAYAEWMNTGCFAKRGEADRWRIQMESAIKSRSPEQIARMEQERGLC